MSAVGNSALAGAGADSGAGAPSVYQRMMAVCDRVASAAVHGADAAELTKDLRGDGRQDRHAA